MRIHILIKNISVTIKNNPQLILAIKNSAWLIFDRLVRMLFGLIIGTWVARYLGPEQYGQLAYVLAFIAFFQVVAVLGMDGIIVREISEDKELSGDVLGTAFILRLISGILCWILSVVFIGILDGWGSTSFYIVLIAGSCLVFQAVDVIDLWFQSQSKSKKTVIAKLIAYFISNGIKVLMLYLEAPLIAFACASMLDVFLSSIGLTLAYRKYSCMKKWVFLSKIARQLINESWPLILSGLSIVVYMRLDQIMIKQYLGPEELGVYAAVIPIAILWSFIPMTLSTSLAPMVAKKKKSNNEDYWNMLTNIFLLLAVLAWVVTIPVSIFSDYLVDILFGQEYSSGSAVLSIAVFVNVAINMGVAQTLWIINEKKTMISFYKTIVGAIVCVISNVILIPRYGITGAAISYVMSTFSSAIFVNIFLSREIFILQLKSLLLIKSW